MRAWKAHTTRAAIPADLDGDGCDMLRRREAEVHEVLVAVAPVATCQAADGALQEASAQFVHRRGVGLLLPLPSARYLPVA